MKYPIFFQIIINPQKSSDRNINALELQGWHKI